MKYFTTMSKASNSDADCVIIGVYNRGKLCTSANVINTVAKNYIHNLIKSGDISSDLGQVALLNKVPGFKANRVAVAGLGAANSLDVIGFKKAIYACANSLRNSKIKTVLNTLTLELVKDCSAYYLARHSVETIHDALYCFDKVQSGKKKTSITLRSIGHSIKKQSEKLKADRGSQHGDAISQGVKLAKDLGNLPANICTPSYLARVAKKLSTNIKNLKTQILNETEMKKLGMGSFLSVTAGATEPGKMIIMQYKGGGKNKPIVLVGKGVTFDTGGISLKPGAHMDEMKFDMCGAASVIGTMLAVSSIKLNINLTIVVPAVENMPAGNATRPGDIVKSMSGQTIEVLNTDAEGRMILCDALTFARKFKPSTIIDVATLTGACVVALGNHRCAIYSNNKDLQDEIFNASNQSDDLGWPMPLGSQYAAQLNSNFADMANIGGPGGGSVTAACFLEKFAEGMNWAHLDIAGVAWKSGKQKGSTGRPVSLLSEFVLSRAQAVS
ncbi:MAG: leucyl aminopeptidase [Gammaproteobacteria bacterium]|nr:leucyl aminopeptidase [Gammaproteobacteria bacterium]